LAYAPGEIRVVLGVTMVIVGLLTAITAARLG
jgi:hypothetical protein